MGTSQTLTASGDFGNEGKQYVARITGRDEKFRFARKFMGRKEGKRGGSTSVLIDEPGLYVEHDVTRKGSTDTYIVLWMDGDHLERDTIDESEALAAAKAIDAGSWDAAEAGKAISIAIHEAKIASYAAKDLDATFAMQGTVGRLVDGSTVRWRDLLEVRTAEIARLRGGGEVDRSALEAEAAKLRVRLAEIETILTAPVG